MVKYKECLKNHAANIGGNATDGCGEFMPKGKNGTLEALICSACNCHRNFHRKLEICDNNFDHNVTNSRIGGKNFVGPHQMNIVVPCHKMGGNLVISELENNSGVVKKKRFRTKFTKEQKEEMLKFAEKIGWKIQKQEENVVQKFCQEIGVKRRIFKVWMHNNKHSFAKKNHFVDQFNSQN
ncbi:hypothetical protein DH2020_024136 [Rehmannia glutinosa]|uniref:ZF-HD dimerization-type domain-containing protein n=1 Tax=Rehmannia glutinosa TaxID=99300 RepID=A0ABR0W8M9_REHGL